MKKSTLLLTAALLLTVAGATCAPQSAIAATDYSVEGGRFTVDFEGETDYQYFDRFTQFDLLPWQMDGAMYAWTLAEQKIILRGKTYADVDVSVDISTINPNGKFDSGIYVRASSPNNALDGINAWEVNVEHGASSSTMALKLHRFENYRYQGAAAEVVGIPYEGDTVHLRVVVKGSMLYAFLNGKEEPTLSYSIGPGSGMVGLRNFYSPNYFDNFTVIGLGNGIDVTELENLKAYAEAQAQLPLAKDCIDELQAAISLAENAQTQTQTDEAIEALEQALARAVTAKTHAELSALISQAEELKNPNGARYTENSWGSLQAVKGICETLTESETEYEISYWYARLEARINGLIAYASEVTQ